jgi:hypothetical protein
MSEPEEIPSNDNLWSSTDQFEQDARVSIADFFDKNKNRVFIADR